MLPFPPTGLSALREHGAPSRPLAASYLAANSDYRAPGVQPTGLICSFRGRNSSEELGHASSTVEAEPWSEPKV